MLCFMTYEFRYGTLFPNSRGDNFRLTNSCIWRISWNHTWNHGRGTKVADVPALLAREPERTWHTLLLNLNFRRSLFKFAPAAASPGYGHSDGTSAVTGTMTSRRRVTRPVLAAVQVGDGLSGWVAEPPKRRPAGPKSAESAVTPILTPVTRLGLPPAQAPSGRLGCAI